VLVKTCGKSSLSKFDHISARDAAAGEEEIANQTDQLARQQLRAVSSAERSRAQPLSVACLLAGQQPDDRDGLPPEDG